MQIENLETKRLHTAKTFAKLRMNHHFFVRLGEDLSRDLTPLLLR